MPAPQRHGDDPRSAILSRNFYGPYGKEFAAGEITGDVLPIEHALAVDGPAVREVLLHQPLRLLRRGSREQD